MSRLLAAITALVSITIFRVPPGQTHSTFARTSRVPEVVSEPAPVTWDPEIRCTNRGRQRLQSRANKVCSVSVTVN